MKTCPDYAPNCEDRELHLRTQNGVYYMLLDVGSDYERIRVLARQWLDKGPSCARAASVADLAAGP